VSGEKFSEEIHMAITNIMDQLIRDEGLRLNVYIDTVGKHTIGVGHNIDVNPLDFDISEGITEAQALQILGVDVERISRFLVRSLPWVVSLDEARYGVLQNLGFNVGGNALLKFHKTLSFAQSGQYEDAAIELENSAWYNEVGSRAKRLVQQMRTGEWV
jgi:lysozyme